MSGTLRGRLSLVWYISRLVLITSHGNDHQLKTTHSETDVETPVRRHRVTTYSKILTGPRH